MAVIFPPDIHHRSVIRSDDRSVGDGDESQSVEMLEFLGREHAAVAVVEVDSDQG